MPARNIYHDAVVQALVADGWTVTHDPLTVSFGGKDLFVDLAAERVTIAAESAGIRLRSKSRVSRVHRRVATCKKRWGNTTFIERCWQKRNRWRVLYLAVPRRIRDSLLAEPFGQLIVSRLRLRLLVFDEQKQRVVQWIE